MTNEFIAGFFTGEGYFYVQNIGKYKGFQLGIHLDIVDLPLLREIQMHLGYGYINILEKSCSFRISKASDINRFLNDVGTHIAGNKKRQMFVFACEFNEYDSKRLPCHRR